jgi:hypothetical protein
MEKILKKLLDHHNNMLENLLYRRLYVFQHLKSIADGEFIFEQSSYTQTPMLFSYGELF